MRHPSAAEFAKSIDRFIANFSKNAPDPEIDSYAVQGFLASMEDDFRAHLLWAGSSEEELQSVGEGLEKYVMTKLYSRLFATVPEDVRSDEDLFENMGLLQHFIRPENLDIKPEFQNESSWLMAQMELRKINLYKAPGDKLGCILNCCKVINNLFVNAPLASAQNVPGADEFLLVLIYIIIKANPPQLHSNLQYIQRFRRRTRLVSESAYFLKKILSAVSFIWNINSEALPINEAEFQRKMDAAREHLLGLSTPSGHSDSEKVSSENLPAQVNGTRDLENEGGAVGAMDTELAAVEMKQPTVPELQINGISGLLKEDNANRWDYPYLFARASDLMASDVKKLLVLYKRLVVQRLVLSKGSGVRTETDHRSESGWKSVETRDLPKTVDNEQTTEVSPAETHLSAGPSESMAVSKTTETNKSEVVDSSARDKDPENSSDDLAIAPLAWHNFLERIRHPSAAEFVKSIKRFIVTLSNNAPDPEVDSIAVQDFLAGMEDAFRVHLLWAGSSEEELENAGEGLEKYVMTELYNRVFATVQEDARGDEDLFEKMSLLQNFICPENLGIKLEFQNESSWLVSEKNKTKVAQKELQKINMYKAPRGKLACILNCCKMINNLFVNAPLPLAQNVPGADEFLLVLIYIIIKANPPQLHSNLQYIRRFRRRTRLVSESAYFFRKILSAVSFVWNINSEALSINEAEFQRKMDAAREHLPGLSPPSRPSDSEKVCSENSPPRVDGTRDLEIKQPIDPELQTKGSFGLLKEDNVDRWDYPYLFARANDLMASDVKKLLVLYKRLVVQHLVQNRDRS